MVMQMNIVLDIETIPCDEETKQLLPPIEAPSKLEGADLEEWNKTTLPKLKEKQYTETALDGAFGQVVCIGLILFDNKKDTYSGKVLFGQDESKLLDGFWSIIAECQKPFFITHNGLNFDLPFLIKRSIIKGIKPSQQFNLIRYRTDFVFDTMAVWSNWDYKKSIKLDLLAKVLNVGSKSGSGKDVFTKWSDEKYKEVAEYCFQDVFVTYACYCKMNFLEIKNKLDIPLNFIEYS